MEDRRRSVPRTDVVLADPRLVEAAGRLGHVLVKKVVVATLARCRAGLLSPADVADAVVWMVTRPRRTAVNEVLMRPIEQES